MSQNRRPPPLVRHTVRHTPDAPTETQAREGGEVIDRHRHDDHQLVYVSSGVVAVRTEHGAWVASNDRAVWIPAGTWHEHRFYGNSRFHCVGFRADDAEPLVDSAMPAVLAVDALTRELLIALTDSALTTPALTPAETGRIEAVLRDRLRRVPTQPITLPAARDPRLAEACRLVEADLAAQLTLAELARRAHVGERTLSRLYREEFGLTFPQWRTRVRIFAAMVLLTEGTPVTTTAHACGWATTSAFITTFARTTGTTPGAYRAGALITSSADPRPPVASSHRS